MLQFASASVMNAILNKRIFLRDLQSRVQSSVKESAQSLSALYARELSSMTKVSCSCRAKLREASPV